MNRATTGGSILYSFAYLSGVVQTHPGKIRFAGLDPNKKYRLTMPWPTTLSGPKMRTEPKTAIEALGLLGEGAVLTGHALSINGLQLPSVFPETTLVFRLVEEQ